ncbi:DExH-box splicing factor binding site-domain-containing protein [Dipodascopsis uninucleata]
MQDSKKINEEPKKQTISFSFGASNKSVESRFTSKNKPAIGRQNQSTPAGSKSRNGHLAHKRRRSPSPTDMITGFDLSGGGAIPVNELKTKEKLVIEAVKNRNWIEETLKKRGRIYKPQSQSGTQQFELAFGSDSKNNRKFGLTLAAAKKIKSESDESQTAVDMVVDDHSEDLSTTSQQFKNQSQEEEAINKIISDMDEDRRQKSNLILRPASTSSTAVRQLTEEEAYRLDIAERPEEPSLEAYEAVPVEEFGYALLRGMGWKDGENIGRSRK